MAARCDRLSQGSVLATWRPGIRIHGGHRPAQAPGLTNHQLALPGHVGVIGGGISDPDVSGGPDRNSTHAGSLESAPVGDDLAQIEAFDLHCRRHGVRLCGEYGWPVADTRALFDVIRHVRDFTVTDEHLRRGLSLFESNERLGAFDAVLAATAIDVDASALVSADGAFAEIAGLPHMLPDDDGVEQLLKG